MNFKKHEVVYDSSSRLYCENYVVLKAFGGNEKMVQCGCGVIFFSNYHGTEINCPRCKADNAAIESIELLAKFAMDNGLEKQLEHIIMAMIPPLEGFDISCEDEFPNLSKYLNKIQ